jgi:TorA maturation chaperone TorD
MSEKPASPFSDEKTAARILALGFLGRAFYEPPSASFLGDLSAHALLEEWPLPADDPATREGLLRMTGYCRTWRAEFLPDIQLEYQRLFGGPDILAPPWESVWRSEEHLMFEEHTLAVREFYARFGLSLPTRDRQPDDHFGLELLFLGHLESLALRSRREGDPAEADRFIAASLDFLDRHLLCWCFAFLARVYGAAQSDYYRGLARLAEGTLRAAARQWGSGTAAELPRDPEQSGSSSAD